LFGGATPSQAAERRGMTSLLHEEEISLGACHAHTLDEKGKKGFHPTWKKPKRIFHLLPRGKGEGVHFLEEDLDGWKKRVLLYHHKGEGILLHEKKKKKRKKKILQVQSCFGQIGKRKRKGGKKSFLKKRRGTEYLLVGKGSMSL